MKHQLRPSIESLETKALLSHMALAVTHIHSGKPVPTETGTTSITHMEVTLTTNQASYTPGEVVKMTFTETNDTGKNAYVNIGPSIDGFSITHGGKTIWRSNAGISPEYIIRRLLLPGQSLTLTANWTAKTVIGAYDAHNQMAPLVVEAPFSISANPVGPSPASTAR